MNQNSNFRIGIDLGGTKIEAAVLDVRGIVVHRERIAAPRGDYAATLAAVRDLVMRAEASCGALSRVGVSLPGAISPATGLVKNANSTWLNGHPFDRDLADFLKRPVRIANDANCFALSEAVDGAAAGGGLVFGVIVGTGCGGGLVLDGKVWTGPHAIAGEWGHNPLPWPRDDERPGPACYCGKRGCIETFLSGPGLASDHLATTGQSADASSIARAADAGDPYAEATLTRYADRFARALATVINVIDPTVVVLGGGLSNIGTLPARIRGPLGAYVFSDRIDTPIRPPAHGDSSGVRGAAWL